MIVCVLSCNVWGRRSRRLPRVSISRWTGICSSNDGHGDAVAGQLTAVH